MPIAVASLDVQEHKQAFWRPACDAGLQVSAQLQQIFGRDTASTAANSSRRASERSTVQQANSSCSRSIAGFLGSGGSPGIYHQNLLSWIGAIGPPPPTTGFPSSQAGPTFEPVRRR